MSGLFKNIIFFTSIIFIHELGHFLCAKFFCWKVDKIYFYPYGGFTKFNDDLNKPKYQELLIMVMGPLFQIIYYFLIIRFLTISELSLFRSYHYSILLFNLLPIYPLDGGKFLNIILNYFISFRGGFKVTIYFSYLVLFTVMSIFFVKNISISLSLLLVFILLICKLTQELKKEKYYFNKFLLERYLNNYNFNKVKIIKDFNGMSRDYKHVFYKKGRTKTEKEKLSSYFTK